MIITAVFRLCESCLLINIEYQEKWSECQQDPNVLPSLTLPSARLQFPEPNVHSSQDYRISVRSPKAKQKEANRADGKEEEAVQYSEIAETSVDDRDMSVGSCYHDEV